MLLRVLLALSFLVVPLEATAKSHRWRFSEFFSNASGTIQYIEMQEVFGSEQEWQFETVPVTSDANTYVFPNDLPSENTAFRWLLIATAGFASLPGAVAPDYVMPDAFFDPGGDTIRYNTIVDLVALGAIPTDGVSAVDRDGLVVSNSPTNFAGEVGHVDLGAPAPMPGGAHAVLAGALLVTGFAALRRRPAAATG